MNKILVFDIETIPFYEYLEIEDPLFPILSKEYKRYMEIEHKKGKKEEDIFISYPQFNYIIAIGWLIANWSRKEKTWVIAKREDKTPKVGCIMSTEDNPEKEILTKFLNYINNHSTEIKHFVHFNGLNFDVPTVIFKAILYNIEIINKKFKYRNKFSLDGHYDIKNALTSYGIFPINLETACNVMGFKNPKNNIHGSEISDLWKHKEYETISKYTIGDVVGEFNLFVKIYKTLINP